MTSSSALPTLAIGLATLAAVAIGELPGLRMNRATIAVTGATILLLTGLRTLPEAYASMDADTLVLLFGMMVLNANLRIAGFFERSALVLGTAARTPVRLLAVTVALSASLSALLLNDTVALGLTPIVLAMTKACALPPLPFLMAVAAAANVGSSATLIGNPQNMIVGATSHIPFVRFTAMLAPAAIGGCALVWAVLAFVYRRELAPRAVHRVPPVAAPAVDHELLRKSLLATVVLLVALVAGIPVPLAALAAASLLLVTRRLAPERVFAEIDWSLLVFFAALFVVTDAIDSALAACGVREVLVAWVNTGPAGLAAVTVVLSNLVSNVPAVLLLRGPVAELPNPERGYLVLAMASTLAGNLTLLGSVANLIVAEIARRERVDLSFREYLRAGLPITITTLALATAWLALAT